MKYKTFIMTFILFLSIFFISLILVSGLFLKSQTQLAMERGINEHLLISDSIGNELKTLIGRGAKKEDAIKYVYDYYSKHYVRQKGYIEIYKESRVLYSSILEKSFGELSLNDTDARTAIIKNVNNKNYVIVVGKFPQLDEDYKIQYIYDITATITTWENMKNTLFFLGIGFSIVVAVLLSLLLNFIFKPLSQVINVSKDIADGNYEKRINISKNHELFNLADNFNYMAKKVQSAIKELSNDAKQKQQFVDNFSHEIRTPLTAIYGFSEYMQKSVLSENEVIDIAGYIMEDSKHILNIADRLLDLATLNKRSIVKSNYSIDDLFNSVAHSLQIRLNEKHIVLIQQKTVETIYGDEDLLKNLLINVTNNAIDASDSKSTIKWIAYKEDGNTILAVSDEGRGIPADEIDKINKPFYRVDKSRNRESGNAGLGLAICQQIAECHNANIVFQSTLMKGTTVKIIFTSS